MTANSPLQVNVKNLNIEYDFLQQSFTISIPCNYPEALLSGDLVFDHISIFYETSLYFEGNLFPFIYYSGPFNISLSHFTSSVHF